MCVAQVYGVCDASVGSGASVVCGACVSQFCVILLILSSSTNQCGVLCRWSAVALPEQLLSNSRNQCGVECCCST